MKKKRLVIGVIVTVVLLGILVFPLANMFIKNGVGSGDKDGIKDFWLSFEDMLPWNGDDNTVFVEPDNECTSIPGFNVVVVNDKQRKVQLYNPPENTVYFVYTITDLKDQVLFETKAISPGAAVEWDVYETMGVGSQKVYFKISTFDIETQAECPGAVLEVNVTVTNSKNKVVNGA